MKRAVLFDTETTGLDPLTGDRVIEIAALELVGDLPTGRHYHVLIDPERDIPEGASRVHGYTRAHLIGQKRFHEVAEHFLAFVADDMLIAHNAPFDFGFINAEFARANLPSIGLHRMIDTLDMARARYPGLPNSLDALCRRFDIDLSARITHNALLDCRLLAQVYVELMGGRQRGFELEAPEGTSTAIAYSLSRPRVARRVVPSERELAAHAFFVAQLKDPVWLLDRE